MVRCLHCGWTSHSAQECPRCRGRLTSVAPPLPPGPDCTEKPGDWLMVARFGNAAEAGYFADELHHRLGCEPRIEVNDDFDAVHACWHTRYSLLVPAVQAEHAHQHLNNMLEGELDQLEPAGLSATADHNPCRDRATGSTGSSAVNWVPIMLTLAAGSFVIWAGNKKAHPPRRPPAPRDGQRFELIDILSSDNAPWVQHSSRGGVRELTVDGTTGAAHVREDADGDGVFEREFVLGRRDN